MTTYAIGKRQTWNGTHFSKFILWKRNTQFYTPIPEQKLSSRLVKGAIQRRCNVRNLTLHFLHIHRPLDSTNPAANPAATETFCSIKAESNLWQFQCLFGSHLRWLPSLESLVVNTLCVHPLSETSGVLRDNSISILVLVPAKCVWMTRQMRRDR